MTEAFHNEALRRQRVIDRAQGWQKALKETHEPHLAKPTTAQSRSQSSCDVANEQSSSRPSTSQVGSQAQSRTSSRPPSRSATSPIPKEQPVSPQGSKGMTKSASEPISLQNVDSKRSTAFASGGQREPYEWHRHTRRRTSDTEFFMQW